MGPADLAKNASRSAVISLPRSEIGKIKVEVMCRGNNFAGIRF